MKVTVFIPGLFTAFKEISPSDLDALACASLSRILSRASKQKLAPANDEHWLYRQFDDCHSDTDCIPVAAVTALSDGLTSQQGYWMRADPVYFYPDTHTLVLQDPDQLKLNEAEVESLAGLVAPLFDAYGAKLIAQHRNRWYLEFGNQTPDISCTPLHEAMAKPANEILPQGEDRRPWHTLFNEIQMLLNQSDVNQQREARGVQPVNSLWFWGEGSLSGQLCSPYEYCIGNDYLLPGLCLATGVPYRPLKQSGLQGLPAKEKILVVDERLQQAVRVSSPDQWLRSLQTIEQETIAPLLAELQRGCLESVNLQDAGRIYSFTKGQLRAFWKPIQKLSKHYQTT